TVYANLVNQYSGLANRHLPSRIGQEPRLPYALHVTTRIGGTRMCTADDSARPGEASSRMLQMLNAFLTVQALHVVAALGIPDRVADQPAAVDDLAAVTGAHPSSLYRLVRMLVGTG